MCSIRLSVVGRTVTLSKVDRAQLQKLELCGSVAANAVGAVLFRGGFDLRSNILCRLDDRGSKTLCGRNGLLGGCGRKRLGGGGVIRGGRGREHKKRGGAAGR